MQPQDFLTDQYQILELRQNFEMAAVEMGWQERQIKALEADKSDQARFFARQLEQMGRSLTLGLSNTGRLVEALSKLAMRPAIDPSTLEAIDRIANSLRTAPLLG